MSWAYIKCLKVLLLDVSGETNDAVCVLWLSFLTLYWFNKDRPLPLHYYTHRFAESASLRCTDYWWELHYPGYGCVCECARVCGYVCSCVNTSMVIVSGNLIVLQNEQIISCRIVTKGISLRWVVQWVFGDCAWQYENGLTLVRLMENWPLFTPRQRVNLNNYWSMCKIPKSRYRNSKLCFFIFKMWWFFLNFNAAMCKFPPRSGLPHVASGLLSTKLSLGTRWIKMLTMQIDTEFSCSAVQGFLYNMHIIIIFFFVLMSEGFGLKTGQFSTWTFQSHIVGVYKSFSLPLSCASVTHFLSGQVQPHFDYFGC